MVGLGDFRSGVAVRWGGKKTGSGGSRRGRGKGMLKMGHCEKNTSGAIINLPLLKPHNEMVQWNH